MLYTPDLKQQNDFWVKLQILSTTHTLQSKSTLGASSVFLSSPILHLIYEHVVLWSCDSLIYNDLTLIQISNKF